VVLETSRRAAESTRAKEVAKAKLASNKIRVFLTAAKGYKEVGE
jgi:hypothetical protein